MRMISSSVKSKLELAAKLLAVFGIFFIPLAAAPVNKLLPLASILAVFSGKIKPKILAQNSVIIWGLVLLGFFIIGVFYSHVVWLSAFQGLGKYGKILYIPFLLPLFTAARWRRIAENALILAVYINFGVALLNVFGIPVFGRIVIPVGGYFVHAIYVSVITSFAAFVLLNRAIDNIGWKRWICFSLFLPLIYGIFFIYIEKTGYLISVLLLILLFWQRWQWKGFCAAIIILPLMFFGLFKYSAVFNYRISSAYSGVMQSSAEIGKSSVGSRMVIAKYSFNIIKKYPLLGTGTGSFADVYYKAGGPSTFPGTILGHPHNEYILIIFQLGAIGLLLFLIWLVVQWVKSYALPITEQRLAQGVILTFIVNSFCNASLSINATGMFYVVFLSVYFAGLLASTKQEF